MGYKLTAFVFELLKTPPRNAPEKKAENHPLESIESLGVWKGKEIFNSENCPNGHLDDIRTQFEKMKRPSPMTLTWKPSQDKIMLFQTLKKKKATLTIRVVVEQRDGAAQWDLNFTGAKVLQAQKENTLERVSLTFEKFYG